MNKTKHNWRCTISSDTLALEWIQGFFVKLFGNTYFSKSGAKSAALDSFVKPVTYNVFLGIVSRITKLYLLLSFPKFIVKIFDLSTRQIESR